jgi:hypothetical protein
VPDEDKYGMIAFIKKKKFFPNVKMKYCTQSLKITPMHPVSLSKRCGKCPVFKIPTCSTT